MRILDYRRRQSIWLLSLSYPISQLYRKKNLILSRLTFEKLKNLFFLFLGFFFGRLNSNTVPCHLKIDVAPSCQLQCPICPHSQSENPDFKSPRLMSVDTFRSLIDDAAEKTIFASLYNLGEPLLHPKLPELACYAENKGINTYVTSNLSLPLKPDYIQRLVQSGLRTLIVAIDGVSTETYGPNRTKGDWKLVEKNLRSIAACKKQYDSQIEIIIQFLCFDYNCHELDDVVTFCKNIDATELHFIKGQTKPWAEVHAPRPSWKPKKAKFLPHCAWPFFSAVIRSNGEVIPCCSYRISDGYIRDKSSIRSLGMIGNKKKLQKIYSSSKYRDIRQTVRAPDKIKNIEGSFCENCGVLSE